MNKKILIVDDEKEIVDLLEVYLSNDGYSVYKCYNGLEAMKCIKQSQIDLAILILCCRILMVFDLPKNSGKVLLPYYYAYRQN